MVYKIDGHARKFIYLHKKFDTEDLFNNAKSWKIVAYFSGEAFDLYSERFTLYNWLRTENKNQLIVKKNGAQEILWTKVRSETYERRNT